jgi:hypothetical protein
MKKHTQRRKRRQSKMKLRSGGKFKVNHKGRSGRTGSMFAKQIAGRVVGRPRSRLASDQRLTAAEGLALNSQQTAGAACEP